MKKIATNLYKTNLRTSMLKLIQKAPVILAATLIMGSTTFISAQELNPYEGYKIPPLEISAKNKYEYNYLDIFGSKMAYIDEGKGDPILFIHGTPMSSYVWRNIMPHVENQGRIIAPDLIGMGKSDKPDLKYTFDDQYKYLDAFIKKMNLKNITLVVHDWGSGLGLHYAHLNPDNIKGIVTMDAVLAPMQPAESYDSMSKVMGDYFRMIQTTEEGKKFLLDDNMVVEYEIPAMIDRPLKKEIHDVYREPYKTIESRTAVMQWPLEVPVGGKPATTAKYISEYNAWLEKTDTPWLFLYATPGIMSTPTVADYWTERAQNIETVYIGNGLHFVQEDHPFAIGRAISDWYRRLNASKSK